ncbi:amino acid ABC transporter permease [Paenibacillus hodogayensis]|uniref:Amino acid ABC transporter permease n=1 Tax=Paenibacillus hodogayensis TaxID=279208 RepID=A0ABV5W6N5_9BACL
MKLDLAFIGTAFIELLTAVPTTLLVTFVAVVCGFLIGVAVAVVRMYRVPVLYPAAAAYVTFIRGTPMLTHLLLVYFGLPALIDGLAGICGWKVNTASIPMIAFAFLAFSLTSGAYMSEVVRSGLLAVGRGQTEAALSLGMTPSQTLRRIVMPQALAAAVPSLSNAVIGMLHASTLVFAVSVVDINAKAQIVASNNWKYFESYLAAAALFWALTAAVEGAAALIERRLRAYGEGGAA